MDQPTEDNLRILAFDNGTASRKWRFDGVADRINAKTPHEMFIANHSRWNGNILGANLVILEMLTGPHIVDQCHEAGAKVIYEADDAVIDSYGRERKNLMHIGPQWRANAIETIAKADAITVTNWELADNYRRFTKKPIYVLPNFVDFDWYGKDDINIQRNSDEIRLGWFGSRGHYEDLRELVPVIGKILEKYPTVKFVYCGYGGMSSEKLLTEVGWGEDVFRELPRNRREFYISAPPEHWPMKHKLLDLDIGMCPLIDDYFNRCKTHIKWMEYAMTRVPAVCSPTIYASSPYGKDRSPAVHHGKTGFIASNQEEWYNHLATLVEDAALRREIGKAAYKEVEKEWDLDRHWEKFLAVYEEVKKS